MNIHTFLGRNENVINYRCCHRVPKGIRYYIMYNICTVLPCFEMHLYWVRK